ncbi:membrane protein [Streptomyces aureoverticillatus]|nr:membrane protein [Streptomyces aureoverticillatus]
MSSEQTQDGQRRRSTLMVASVAAAVLLAGGGGAYLAASSDDTGRDSSAGDGSDPPPLTLDGYAGDRDGRSSQGPTGTTEGIAPGEPDPNGATYKAVGELPDGPESAAVHHVRGEVPRDRVSRLAKALGLSGSPVARDGAWRVGPSIDGAGPSLRVGQAAPGTWTYTRHAAPGSDNCLKGKRCPGAGTRTADDSGDAVSEAAAKKAAAPVLKAAGLDDAKLDAGQLMGSVRVVNADPEVHELPTYGWATGIQVGADGQVVGGSGHLTEPEKGATYPVVGARKALDLLNKSGRGDGPGGIGGCATPVPHADGGGAGDGDREGRGTGGAAPDGGSTGGAAPNGGSPGSGKDAPCEPAPTPPKPQPIAVEDAEFGLAAQFVDGSTALVPSWLFRVKPQGAPEAYTVTHPAVDPKYLRAPTPGTVGPSQGPTVEPGDPDTRTSEVKIDGYSTAGRTLTAHFTGGVCSTYAASADERDGQVAVKVTETEKKGTVCAAVARFYELSVTLDKPLGDRKVVTGDGRAVPRDDGTREGIPAPRK